MTSLDHVNVFVSGQDGYQIFRIPALGQAADGSLLAVAEARKNNHGDPGAEGNEIHLVQKRSTDGGRTWSAMTLIEAPGPLWSAGNPAVVLDRTNGRLWLHYLRCRPGRGVRAARPGTDDIQNLVRSSDDGGVSWSEPTDITAICRDMNDSQWTCSVVGPGGGIQDSQGRLILASWKWPYSLFALFSEDHGRTWQRGELAPGAVGNEDQLVELSDGRLLLDGRQGGGSHRLHVISSDGGRTWSTPRPGIEVVQVCCAIERCPGPMDQGPARIVWTGPAGPGRSNLVARFSSDDGQSFPVEQLVAAEPAAYSDLAALHDGGVGVLWERGEYRFITYTHLDRGFLDSAR